MTSPAQSAPAKHLLHQHACSGVALRCIDFRFRKTTDAHIQDEHLLEFDGPLTAAGGVQALLDPDDRRFLVKQLTLAHKLHCGGKWTIALLTHTDCGKYKADGLTDPTAQRTQQISDHKAARQLLLQEFPDATVRCLIAIGNDDGSYDFEEVEV
ncbi:MAG: carbonic anhydrase [Candidatus Spechtbacterales bacterium]